MNAPDRQIDVLKDIWSNYSGFSFVYFCFAFTILDLGGLSIIAGGGVGIKRSRSSFIDTSRTFTSHDKIACI